jgi:hypothetical protein
MHYFLWLVPFFFFTYFPISLSPVFLWELLQFIILCSCIINPNVLLTQDLSEMIDVFMAYRHAVDC